MGTAHRQEVTDVFYFEQLSDEAKEKARDWYRSGGNHQDWHEGVYEQAELAAKLLGIEISPRRGSKELAIFYSGFCSQGDGACFEGIYSYATGSVKAVKKEFKAQWKDSEGKTVTSESAIELHRIATELQKVQQRFFYKLVAHCAHRGHYYHSGCMGVDVSHDDDICRDIGDAEDDIRQLMRDFADWIYGRLEDEDTWLNSDEAVDESMAANEYEFDEEGNRV